MIGYESRIKLRRMRRDFFVVIVGVGTFPIKILGICHEI